MRASSRKGTGGRSKEDDYLDNDDSDDDFYDRTAQAAQRRCVHACPVPHCFVAVPPPPPPSRAHQPAAAVNRAKRYSISTKPKAGKEKVYTYAGVLSEHACGDAWAHRVTGLSFRVSRRRSRRYEEIQAELRRLYAKRHEVQVGARSLPALCVGCV